MLMLAKHQQDRQAVKQENTAAQSIKREHIELGDGSTDDDIEITQVRTVKRPRSESAVIVLD